jgi:flagellar FliL protein
LEYQCLYYLLRSSPVAEEDKKDASAPENDLEKEAGGASGENGEGTEEGGLNPPKRRLSKKQKIIAAVVAGVLLLGCIGVGLYFAGVFGGGTSHETVAEGAKEAHGEAPAEGEAAEEETSDAQGKEAHVPVFYALGDILVNLAGDGKRPNYLKLTISLELADEKDKATLDALKPRIVDQFQLYLRELRVEDLRGSAGLFRLREELLLRVSEVVQPIRIRDVLFQEMLVQ